MAAQQSTLDQRNWAKLTRHSIHHSKIQRSDGTLALSIGLDANFLGYMPATALEYSCFTAKLKALLITLDGTENGWKYVSANIVAGAFVYIATNSLQVMKIRLWLGRLETLVLKRSRDTTNTTSTASGGQRPRKACGILLGPDSASYIISRIRFYHGHLTNIS